MKGTWKTINAILNITKRKKKCPHYFKDGNNVVTDKLKLANHFNSFFTKIGPNLSNLINIPTNKTFKTFLNSRISHSFNFKNINDNLINEIIDKLSPKTSTGHDGLSTKLLKTVKNALIAPITIIVNQMLNTGIFPDKLKIAKVNPIFKKDDEMQVTNYRPISLLPSI